MSPSLSCLSVSPSQGIETVYSSVGRPGIFRNDRFWLAGDHRVEPELYDQPKVRKLMELSERAQKDFKMTDFQGFNVRMGPFHSQVSKTTDRVVHHPSY
jgi:hypothetical protein